MTQNLLRNPQGMSLKAQPHPRLLMDQEHTGNIAGKLALQSPWTKSQEAPDEIRASQHNLGLWRVRSGAPRAHVTHARQSHWIRPQNRPCCLTGKGGDWSYVALKFLESEPTKRDMH